MDKDREAVGEMEWRTRPLCCRYLVNFLYRTRLTIERLPRVAIWTLGLLDGGQHEVAGAWLSGGCGRSDRQAVLYELTLRGVERVRFEVSGTAAQSAEVDTFFLGTKPLPSFCDLRRQSLLQVTAREQHSLTIALSAVVEADTSQGAGAALDVLLAHPLSAKYPDVAAKWRVAVAQRAPFYALGDRRRRLIRTAEGMGQSLRGRLARAAARHGSFANDEAALSFLGGVLLRAQRELDLHDRALGSPFARDRLLRNRLAGAVPFQDARKPRPAAP